MKIREARANEDNEFYDILLMSTPEYETFFGQHAGKVMKHAFRHKKNLFSHEHVLVAETDGRVAGMILSYNRRDKEAEEFRTALRLLQKMNFGLFLKLPLIIRSSTQVGIIGKREHFISNVAAYTKFRGMGVGAALIGEAEKRARAAGDKRMVLEVDTDNAPAIGFYKKHGYYILNKGSIKLDKMKCFYRMGKKIE